MDEISKRTASMYGTAWPDPPAMPIVQRDARIEELERRIKALEDWIALRRWPSPTRVPACTPTCGCAYPEYCPSALDKLQGKGA
jgi:hypothetical protein